MGPLPGTGWVTLLEWEVWLLCRMPVFPFSTGWLHLGVGRGQAFSVGRNGSGQAASYPPTPEINPELTGSFGKASEPDKEWDLNCECKPPSQALDREILLVPRRGVSSAGGSTFVQSVGSHSSRTMAPPRNVVKIAVQKADAIPQLIQLDQVNGTVRTPPPTLGCSSFLGSAQPTP